MAAFSSCGLLSACGSDREGVEQAASPSATAPSTAPTVSTETVPTTTTERPDAKALERQAERRRAARKRRQARAEARAKAKTTTSERSTPATTAEPPQTTAQSSEPKQKPRKRTPSPKPQDTGLPTHNLTENATMQLVSRKGSRAYVHEGNVVGTLNGTMRLNTKLGGEGVIGIFTVTLADGTLTGRASAALTLAGSEARFRGTAKITGGTGTYANASASGLKFSGKVSADASTSRIQMSGPVRY